MDSAKIAYDSRFMRAARGEDVDMTPVWIMRQAGRYLPEYMAVRSKVTFIELCKRPELAAEVTLTARSRLNVDAAILFADLLPMLEPMGIDLEYAKGEGPVIHNPLHESREVDRIKRLESMDTLDFVLQAVKLIRRDLPPDIPLLGFAGAPFTLASYMIEGGGSRNYIRTKQWMYKDPGGWRTLMDKLVDSLILYVNAQVDAGCQAIQIFDSWAGCLSPHDYREYVLPHTSRLIAGIKSGTPVINFLTGNPALLPLFSQAGGEVIGLDWRVDLMDGWKTVGFDRAVQGNLDPVLLFADQKTLLREALKLLEQVGKRPGHIFNLGHGVLPETPVENVLALVEFVHENSTR